MRCLFCGVALAPLRLLTDGQFCSDPHRDAFGLVVKEAPPLCKECAPYDGVPEPVRQAPAVQLSAPRAASLPRNIQLHLALPLGGRWEPSLCRPIRMAQGWPIAVRPNCTSKLESADVQPPPASPNPPLKPVEIRAPEVPSVSAAPPGEDEVPVSPANLLHFWGGVPRDLKLFTLLVPALLGVLVYPRFREVHVVKANTGRQEASISGTLTRHLDALKTRIAGRAAVNLAEDFRSGLDDWWGKEKLTSSWSYDPAGFVRPGPLALFRPTIPLSDYRLSYVTQIERGGLGAVVRASSLDNYHAFRLVVEKPGPLPVMRIVRYTVVNGAVRDRVEKPLPLTVTDGTLFHVTIEARGPEFTATVQNQLVDYWQDSRLPGGGVGFFCNRGERARLSWLDVSHQNDSFGRLCALLAPFGSSEKHGSGHE